MPWLLSSYSVACPFWLVTTGSWPTGGEIDVAEGRHGYAAWHYHYLSSSGVSSQVGGGIRIQRPRDAHLSGHWTTAAITFYYDGTQVGQVTSAEIGVPLACGPMFVIDDYVASPTYGGRTTGNVNMQVLNFTP